MQTLMNPWMAGPIMIVGFIIGFGIGYAIATTYYKIKDRKKDGNPIVERWEEHYNQ